MPTEAEWEYAARAGTVTRWSFGDDESVLGDHAWFDGNSGGAFLGFSSQKTHPVGEKQPNPWGLYDIHGNVWEWIQDGWHENYTGALSDGMEWCESCVSAGRSRVWRGGSWGDDARYARVSYRNGSTPGGRTGRLGLRLAQDL